MKKRGPKNAAPKSQGAYKNNLRNLRIAKNLTQEDIAMAVGKTIIDISRLENGKIGMSEDYIRALNREFGWSASNLLGEVIAPKGNELSDGEIALISAIKDIIQIMTMMNPNVPPMLRNVFSYQRAEYEEKNLPNAVQVMEILGGFVGDSTPGTEQTLIRRLLQIAPAGSA